MVQSYSGDPVVPLGLEMWNGSLAQANAFLNTTGMTFPLLRNAGAAGVGSDYQASWDISFVLDGDGIIRHRGSGFNETQVRAAIDDALAMLPTGVDTPTRPEPFLLHPARPNPFNPATTIAWTIDPGIVDAAVKVEIHDLRGRRLATLVDERQQGGREHSIRWDGRGDDGRALVSGTYVASLDVDGVKQARFISLVK